MAKKGQAQLQIEVANDEDWEKLLQKEGLIVVDIYSDWCGPCAAMLNNLKKLKLEVGGDYLHIVQAKCDGITDLVRFRNKSEPTWMMIAKGKMVNLVFGANSPKLLQVILDELNKEALAREGVRERQGIEVYELSPEEQEHFDAIQALEEERIRIEEERRIQILHDRRVEVANVVLSSFPKNGVVVVFPQAKDIVKTTLADLWEPAGLAISATERPIFTEKILEELLYFADTAFNEMDVVNLLSGPTIAYLTKPTDNEFSGSVDEAVLNFVYGEMMGPPGSPECPAELLTGYIVVPKNIKNESEAILQKSGLSLSPASKSNPSMGTSKAELRSKLEVLSGTVMMHSRAMLVEAATAMNEEEEDNLQISGLWAPPNALTRATAIKLLFPKVYDPIAVPEPVPIPPHIAIAFDALKRRDVFDCLNNYEKVVMRYGFFSDDKPETAKIIAKSLESYERLRSRVPGIKLVIQLSKKKSEAWCALSQLNPTYMSHNTVTGEKECKLFFPEGYDEEESEEVQIVEVKKKKGKKGKKGKPTTPTQEDLVEKTEGEEEDEDEEDDDPEEVDKATSPMPDAE